MSDTESCVTQESEESKMISIPTYKPRDHADKFDPAAYLSSYYTDYFPPAMSMVLEYMPSIAERIPNDCRLLDIGSGPTVHLAFMFRNRASQIFLRWRYRIFIIFLRPSHKFSRVLFAKNTV